MKLAVCLITADRSEYTKATLESFTHYNAGLDCLKLHADDASKNGENWSLAKQHGFLTVVKSPDGRRGGQTMRREVINQAAHLGASHVMILENDIETARPFPIAFLEFAFQRNDVYCARLYGEYKERNNQRRCGRSHYGKGKDTYNPNWQTFVNPQGENAQIGDIHWGAQPCVTRIKDAVWLHDGTMSEGQIRKKCASMTELTVRTMDNVCYHMGALRTPDFRQ